MVSISKSGPLLSSKQEMEKGVVWLSCGCPDDENSVIDGLGGAGNWKILKWSAYVC